MAATATPVPVATARPVRPTVGATPSDMVNATPTVPATTQKTEKTGATIINAAGEAEAIGWKDILENIRQNVSDSSNKEIYYCGRQRHRCSCRSIAKRNGKQPVSENRNRGGTGMDH